MEVEKSHNVSSIRQKTGWGLLTWRVSCVGAGFLYRESLRNNNKIVLQLVCCVYIYTTKLIYNRLAVKNDNKKMDDAKAGGSPDFYRGSPVAPEDLRYRDPFLESIWSAILLQHVLLTAPRRTGKTSIMDHLQAYPKHGFLVIKENVQDLSHPADVLAALLARFHDEQPQLLRDTLAKGWSFLGVALKKVDTVSVSEFKVALRESDDKWRENWRQHGEKLLAQLRRHDGKVLIIIDELPDMLLNLKEEDEKLLGEFLAWFRAQRQTPAPKNDPVRWLVGGSVNLSGTLDSVGKVDLINDLDDIPLPVLSDGDVRDFVVTMLDRRGVRIEQGVAERCLELLGRPIPLFMQMMTQDLHRMWRKRADGVPLAESDVDLVFKELVRSSAAQDKLQHYYSRLKKYYGDPKLAAAHLILAKLSLSEKGISRPGLMTEFQQVLEQADTRLPVHEAKQVFNQLMRDLENDFYVEEVENNRFDFSSGVLKTWWRKYYA